MKLHLSSWALAALIFAPTLKAQNFVQLWQLGAENGNQSEFSQENGNRNDPPGSAARIDDDYYFAGTYPDPIGVLATNEPTKNFERALVPSDPFLRIHFNLDSVAANSGADLKVTIQTCCIGKDAAIEESTHDLVIRFNDKQFFTQANVTEGILIEKTQKASAFGAKVGENIIEIERTDGSAASWIQFDYIRLEMAGTDTDGDGLPTEYEKLYPAFLDPTKKEDAAKDQDGDGLTNLEEFTRRTKPDVADTDGDGLKDGEEVKTFQSDPLSKDSDNDGLADAAEVSAKTELTKADTDEDGLSDGEEVNTHKTNPLVADTDKDSYSDGDEVANASNPNDANSKPLTYAQLWLLGAENGNQSEFSQERGLNEAPGSPEEQDDDFYFAGTYPAPIGLVKTDEDFLNFDRALVPGDPFNRIHFNLDAAAADPSTDLRVVIQTCCLGAGEGIPQSTHDVVVRFNGKEFFSKTEIIDPIKITKAQKAAAFGAKVGANVIEIERTGGSGASWIQFDYIRLEYSSNDTDKDGMSNEFERLYPAFLDPNKPEDAAKDQDGDGLTNLEEFKANSKPDVVDSDGDGLRDNEEVKQYSTNPSAKDSDGDGLEDGAEVNTHKTNPAVADTDGDGTSDGEEIRLGLDPKNADSKPASFAKLWQIGEANGNQSEFSQEAGGSPEAPGSAEALDDDYYLAGTYPDPIGKVAQDEDWTFFERALTSGNFFSRMHFNLSAAQATASSEYQLTFQLCCLGSDAATSPTSVHDLTFRFNGNEFHVEPQLKTGKKILKVVPASLAKPKAGENIIEIERTDGTAASWVQFDYIRAEHRDAGSVAPPVTGSSNFRVTSIVRGANALELKWNSTAGKKYGVEYSADLKGWQNVGNADATTGSTSYSDADATRRAAKAGYYRVRQTN